MKAVFFIRSEEFPDCPQCGAGALRSIGRRRRCAIWPDGVKRYYLIPRFYCRHCGKIHHALPDFMIPFKQHTAQLVEQIVEMAGTRGNQDFIPCYDNTIKNLREWFDSIASEIAERLECLLHLTQSSARASSLQRIRNAVEVDRGWLKKAVATLVNKNCWVTTRLLC